MIANCPSCGTHYKHEPPKVRVRARCGRCDTAWDLGRLSPYRIVRGVAPTAEQARRAASHLPIGLDHPALATEIAQNVSCDAHHDDVRPVLASLPVMIPTIGLARPHPSSVQAEGETAILREGVNGDDGRQVPDEATPEASSNERLGLAAFVLFLATGAVVGTGASWAIGGTTMIGMAAGTASGALAAWVWQRWMSPK